jgi:uncharacterized protein
MTIDARVTPVFDGYCTVGVERETSLSPDRLLQRMDQAGIGRAVIAPDDREIAVNNRSGNDRILGLSRSYGGRFVPACAVNPWFGEAGRDELRRAVENGARLLVVSPALQGFCPADDIADQLVQAAAKLRVPVYVHTGSHSYGAPTQLALLAARHPQTRFILGHCGSTDYAYDMTAVFRAGLENVWFEVSLARPWAAGAYATAQGRRAKIIFGSSAPRNDPLYELQQLDKYLSIKDYPDVYGGNLSELLGEVP